MNNKRKKKYAHACIWSISKRKYEKSNEIFDYKAWEIERTEKNREEKGYRIEESQSVKRSPYITTYHICEKSCW